MKAIFNPLWEYPKVMLCLSKFQFSKSLVLFTSGFLFFAAAAICQTNNYFGSTGSLGGAVWSTNPAGPYTSPLNAIGGAIINFGNVATVTGATIDVKAINATADVTSWTNVGTLGTGGSGAAINVAPGITLNMLSQAISTAAGTGFIKSGAGCLALGTGSGYAGGFVLNAGTIIIGGINALGNNTLALNGGIIASNASRDLSGKYPGGMVVGGDIQFGDIIGLANSSANLTFDNAISLGAANRTLTSGNAGTVSLKGVISGSAGISFNANANGSGIIDITNTANLFTGTLNVNGGNIRFAADGSFGNAANTIVLDGGKLLNGGPFSVANTHTIQLGITVGTGITVGAGSFSVDAVIADKTTGGSFTKYGAGTLVLNNANTYTGITFIDAGGGILQLNKPGGTTLPATNNVVQNGGTFHISSNQTLNNLSMTGGTLLIDNGITLVINGTLDYFQPAIITLIGTGKIAYGPAGSLKYSGSSAKTITAVEFPVVAGPVNVVCDNSNGVVLPFDRTITGSLQLLSGTFNIGAGSLLDLNGAVLIAGGGFLAGNAINNASSDLTVRGNSGGTVTLPTNNISIGLRNLTVTGSRTVALNGVNDLHLSGTLSVGATAAFDNGGESQLVSGGGIPAIIIAGKFINRDQHNFTGTNGVIPGISPVLSAGSTIEYGLATGTPQTVTARADYSNLLISGTGIKTPSTAFNPTGTITITGSAIFDCTLNNVGDINTNLTMDGGRLIVGTGGTQPQMDGIYQLTAGIVEFAGTTAKTIRTRSYQNIEITGTSVGNSGGNITLKNLGSFTVKSGASFTINDNNITGPTGTQTVTVENGATFNCGNSKGFNGFVPTLFDNSSLNPDIEFINLGVGSTINYSRDNDQEITIANGLFYQNLVISGSGGIKKAPSSIITVMGNLLKAGGSSFAHNNGKVVFNNTASIQSFTNTGTTPFNFYDFTNSNSFGTGLNILNDLGIVNSCNLSANSKLNLLAGDVNLLSATNTTAYVAPVPATASVTYLTGRFNVERYFPADRAWRMVTCPLSMQGTPGTIFSNWQNNGVYTTGKGTLITGKLPGPVNGLDDSFYDNYSMKRFENNGYTNVTSTLVPLSGGLSLTADNIGYFLFVRGDRNPLNAIFPNTNNTTLGGRGKLQTGQQIMQGLARTGTGRFFAIVGNPYPSPVDFNSLTRFNLLKRFVVFDPKINQVGAYIEFDDFDGDGIYSQSKASPGLLDWMIQSGQAFIVETDAAMGPASIVFEESSKTTIQNSGMFKPIEPSATIATFRTSLNLLNADYTTRFADGNLAEFKKGYNDGADFQDAVKFVNINETFALTRNQAAMGIERRPEIDAVDTLFFDLTKTTRRSYQFYFEPNHLNPLLTAMLEDGYTGASVPVSVTQPGYYNFTVNNDIASNAANRFRIVFKLSVAGALPVSFRSIKAWQQGSSVAIKWTVSTEEHVTRYELQKSNDGLNFISFNPTAAAGVKNNFDYTCYDINPIAGENYYRIRIVNNDGQIDYSPVARVQFNETASGISIFPNPVTGNKIGVRFTEGVLGNYLFRVFNSLGQLIFIKKINHAGGAAVEYLQLKNKLAPGIYQLAVSDPFNKTTHLKILGERGD